MRKWLGPQSLFLFLLGVLLFLGVRWAWGDEGVHTGRIVAISILAAGFIGILIAFTSVRRRAKAGGSNQIIRLLRAGRVDEAVKAGRALFEKSPEDPHVLWNYTAALIKSGHLAEARRVFSELRRESLPPKMAAMHDEVRRALESGR